MFVWTYSVADFIWFKRWCVAGEVMQYESVEDEFELFRAQSYGVESVLRHQRAASVRASAKVKVTAADTHGDLGKQSPEVVPQPRPAAERKASFKSSARRRLNQRRIPEEVITADVETTSGRCDRCGPNANEGRSGAADDAELVSRRRRDGVEVDESADVPSPELYRVYRMRSFYCKSGNIVNRGDSVRTRAFTSGGARSARDAVDVLPSTGSSILVVPVLASAKESAGQSADNDASDTAPRSDASRDHLTVGYISTSGPTRRQKMNSGNESTEDAAASAYRVLVLGSQGVGKTTLTEQLMTSEYLANKESFAGTTV